MKSSKMMGMMDMMMNHPKGFQIQTRNHLMFKDWKLDSYAGLIGAMLMTVAFSIFLEFINGITKVVAEGKGGQSKGQKNRTLKEKLVLNAKLSVLQMSRVLLAYLLMLCVMTMNLWIYMSTMIGAGIGYFFAGILFQKSSNQENREIDNKRTEGATLLSEEENLQHKEETQFDPLLTKDTVV